MAEDAQPDGLGQSPRRGLLMDWGGVMTTDLLASFSAFCEAEGLDPNALRDAFRHDREAQELLFAFEEGRLAEDVFEPRLGALLGVASAEGLIERLFAGSVLDEEMVEAVRAARRAGVRTGMVSNSWGTGSYPRPLLGELFDGMVISGEVGIRKPAPRIYEMGAEAIGCRPRECVFVDDLPFNLTPAHALGMATVRHRSARETIPQLERLLDVALTQPA